MTHLRRLGAALFLVTLSAACAETAPAVDDCRDGEMAGPVYARSDEDVAALSGCTTVTGSLYLWGDAITTLAPLADLERVEGTLSLQKTTAIDARGLESLADIGGCLEVRDNPELVSLDGLGSLEGLGGCLSIGRSSAKGTPYGNPRLENIDGLASLSVVGGFASIENNAALADLDGLGRVRGIGGDLTVARNALLGSVDGLLGVTDLGGDLSIGDNPSLSECDAKEIASDLDPEAQTFGNDDDCL